MKYAAFGTELYIDSTLVASMQSLSGPSPTFDTIDVTTHDSPGGWEELLPSLLRSGELEVEILYDPADLSHQAIVAALGNTTPSNIAIVFPDVGVTTWTFKAYVIGFETNFPVEDKLSATVSLKVVESIDFGTVSP